MEQSNIDRLVSSAKVFFEKNNYYIPRDAEWDVTDFGKGQEDALCKISVTLSNEELYCEKLMYAVKGMCHPIFFNHRKKKDIICRVGGLSVYFYCGKTLLHCVAHNKMVKKNGKYISISCCEEVYLSEGDRVTIDPGVCVSYQAQQEEVIIGEISNYNDDLFDTYFIEDDDSIVRFDYMINY